MSGALLAFLGAFSGFLLGLVPGLHVNTLLSLPLAGLLSSLSGFDSVVFVFALTAAHAVSSFVPAILFGAPSESTLLSALPGHRMLLEGRGKEALMLSAAGCLFGTVFGLLLAFPLAFFAHAASRELKALAPSVLFALLGFVALSEESDRKALQSLAVAFSAGLFGWVVLSKPFAFDSLFPALGGLFGVSSLAFSLMQNTSLPAQEEKPFQASKGVALDALKALPGAFLLSFFPAAGAGQAALLSSELLNAKTSKAYIVLTASISTSSLVLGVFALHFLGEAHSGFLVKAAGLLPKWSDGEFYALLSAMALSAGISCFLSIAFATRLIKTFQEVDYFQANLSVLLFLLALVAVLTGLEGLLVCLTGALVGLSAMLFGVKRLNLIAFLSVPTFLLRLS